MSSAWCGLSWSPWCGLLERGLPNIPRTAGLYRVRRIGSADLMYVGQTGLSLVGRLQQLRAGLQWDEMPFDDPHTCTPNLWCYRVEDGAEYEVSATKFDSRKEDRLALECYVLWQYRLARGESTLCNFGHFHIGFSKSKNRKVGVRGARLETPRDARVSMPPLQPRGKWSDTDWMGLAWSEWTTLNRKEVSSSPAMPGLYRIKDDSDLLYIGESESLKPRLLNHLSRFQYGMVSYVQVNGCAATQRHELESDLIGATYSELDRAPLRQFGVLTTLTHTDSGP
ncbi:MAG: hypothetical protein EOP84_06285 [Verrucomicrobiaceae bacterium]|nr:MAG: hypothetical protein EOP84_06285 [Verrucomicrobiaceae bacterium]